MGVKETGWKMGLQKNNLRDESFFHRSLIFLLEILFCTFILTFQDVSNASAIVVSILVALNHTYEIYPSLIWGVSRCSEIVRHLSTGKRKRH